MTRVQLIRNDTQDMTPTQMRIYFNVLTGVLRRYERVMVRNILKAGTTEKADYMKALALEALNGP